MTAKEFLESQGYEFPNKDLWMEDYVTEHKFKDLVDLMERYCQSQKAQAWEECSERWKDTINDEYNWPEPVNPYLIETKKD